MAYYGYLGPPPGSLSPSHAPPPNHFENAFHSPVAQPHVGVHVDPFHHQYGGDVGVQQDQTSAMIQAKVNTQQKVSQVGTSLTLPVTKQAAVSVSESVGQGPGGTQVGWMASLKAKLVL